MRGCSNLHRSAILSHTVSDVVLLIAPAAANICAATSHSADAHQWACASTCLHTPSKHSTAAYVLPLLWHYEQFFFFFVLFCYFFSSGLIQEWCKSICLTFVHNIWPVVYSTATSYQCYKRTCVSFYDKKRRNTSSSLLLSSPFHNNESILCWFHSGKERPFEHEHDEMRSNPIYCGGGGKGEEGGDSQREAFTTTTPQLN